MYTELEEDSSVTEEFITLTDTSQIEERDQNIREIENKKGPGAKDRDRNNNPKRSEKRVITYRDWKTQGVK